METIEIKRSVQQIMQSLPQNVLLVAASKQRTIEEVQTAIEAGIKVIGHNYVQQAERMQEVIGYKVQWHMIGHLQKNKVNKAVKIFDMIETVDSFELAEKINERCEMENKFMPILIEINSGREPNKTGALPEEVDELILQISELPFLEIQGLMTMGPRFGNPEDARPYFKATKAAFDRLNQARLDNVEMLYLSMGMSNSYQIAIEEGANMVRIGSKLFGERKC